MSEPAFDVIVIGEGASGLTAAGALAAAGLNVATLEAQLFGGLVINVNELDPSPVDRIIGGAEFCAELMQKNAEAGVTSIQEPTTGIAQTAAGFEIATDTARYGARQVLVASGARLKKLGVPGEAEFEGRGVSQCADCDGPMMQGEAVVVVGGGDSALQEAIVLTQFCSRVHLVHRGDRFRGRAHFADQVAANEKIIVHWNATVEEIRGGQMVEAVRIKHADGRAEEIACAGVFAYIGLEPNTDFAPPAIARDAAGFLVTNDSLETALGGVWAIGAVRSGNDGSLAGALAEAERAAQAIRTRLA